MDKSKMSAKGKVLTTLIITLFPFFQSAASGVDAIAETMNETGSSPVTLYEEESAKSTVNYTVDPQKQTVEWRITTQRKTNDSTIQFGYKLASEGKPIQPTEVKSTPENLFETDAAKGQMLEDPKQVSGVTDQRIVLDFKTPILHSLSIQAIMNELQADHSYVDRLADHAPTVITIDPSKTAATTLSEQQPTLSSTDKQTAATSTTTSSEESKETTTTSSTTDTNKTISDSSAPTKKTQSTTPVSVGQATPASGQTTASSKEKDQVDLGEADDQTFAKEKQAAEQRAKETNKPQMITRSAAVTPMPTGRDITTLPGSDSMKVSPEGKTIIDSATLTKSDGTPVDSSSISLNDHLLLNYSWSLPEALRQNIKAGDYYSFQLPDKFVIQSNQLSGSLSNANKTVFATFVIDKTGKVTITFTNAVETMSGIKGDLSVAGVANKSKITTPGKNDIDIPFTDTKTHVVPNITVPNTKALDKQVAKQTANADIKNNQAAITWSMIANRTGSVMTDGALIDTLPKGVTYTNGLNVQAQAVDLSTGDLTGPLEDVTSQVMVEQEGQQVTFHLPTSNKAYLIHFDTKVDLNQVNGVTDPTKVAGKVVNNAVLRSKETKDIPASATANFASTSKVAKKFDSFDDGTKVAKWELTFTKSGIDIPAGTIIKDIMDNGQVISKDTGAVMSDEDLAAFFTEQFTANGSNAGKTITVLHNQKNETKKDPTNKSITGTSYDLQFPQGISDTFTLTYYTKVGGTGQTFNNQATWNNTGQTPGGYLKKPNTGIVKAHDPVTDADYSSIGQTKKAHWYLDMNSQHTSIDNWQVVDALTANTTMGNDDLKGIDVYEVPASADVAKKLTVADALKATDTKKLIAGQDYEIVNQKAGGFTINYLKNSTATTSRFIVSYTSSYIVGNKTLSNTATYHAWKNGTDFKFTGKDHIDLQPDNRRKVGGAKSGSYNDRTNTVAWTLNVNTSKLALGDHAVVSDPIPGDQTYLPNTIKITNGAGTDVTKDFTIDYMEPGQSKTIENKTFTAASNPNGTIVVTGFTKGSKDTYTITFNAKVNTANNALAEGTSKNTAAYSDDSNLPFTFDTTVSYTNKDNYIDKKHDTPIVDKNGMTTIPYTILINKDKHELKNVTLTDGNRKNILVDNSSIVVKDSQGNTMPASFYTLDAATQQFSLQIGTTKKDDQGNMILGKDGKPARFISDSYTVTYQATVLYAGGPGSMTQVQNQSTISGENLLSGSKSDNDNLNVLVPNAAGKADGANRDLILTKRDSQTKALLPGAELTLYQEKNGHYQKYDVKTTDGKGAVEFDTLTYGKYKVVETKAPAGYFISSDLSAGKVFEVNGTIGTPNKPQTVDLTNDQVGQIHLTKVDHADTAKRLAGAVFALYQGGQQVTNDTTGDLIGEIKTDEDGNATIKNLVPGTYQLKEITAPTGYTLDKETTPVLVESGKTTDTTISNTLNRGTIQFKKQSQTGQPLAGAEFTLTDEKGQVVKKATSDKDGSITFDLEANHTYAVEETKNPTGYSGTYKRTGIRVTGPNQVVSGEESTPIPNNTPQAVTNTLDTVTISGTKHWNLNGLDTKYQPKTIEVKLVQTDHAGKTKVLTTTTSAANGWNYSFKELPKYDLTATGDQPFAYHYEVTDAVPGFAATSDTNGNLTNTLITVPYVGIKHWADGKDQFGLRPKSITLQLMQNGRPMTNGNGQEYIQTVTPPADNKTNDDWTYTFNNLPKTDQNGNDYVYSVQEVNVPNGYDEAINGMNVTNTLRKTSVSGTKTWEDVQDAFGLRPQAIHVQLMQNGQAMGEAYQKKVTAADNWQYTFNDLPAEDANGQAYNYTVKELDPPKAYTVKDGTSMDVVNTLNTTDLSGTKTWQDASNQFGTRPQAIRIQLMQNGAAMQGNDFVKTVTAKDQWTYNFTGLPKADADGKDYQYTVKELDVPKAYASQTNAMNVTNTLATTTITATKNWSDQEDLYRLRPATIQLALYQNGTLMKDTIGTNYQPTVQADAEGNWHYTFTGLPKMDTDGKDYQYTVKEVNVPNGYSKTENGTTVTNQLILTELSGTKQWEDMDDQYGVRPQAIQVQLLQDGQPMTDRKGQTYQETVTKATNWHYHFTELPKVAADGHSFVYTVSEKPIAGYTPTYTDSEIVNTLDTTQVTVHKFWNDQENAFATRPDKITFHLMVKQNGQWAAFGDVYKQEKTMTLSGPTNQWTGSFTDLPKYDTNGSLIVYGVQEILPNANTYHFDGAEETEKDRIVPANSNGTADFINTLSTVGVTVKKNWTDFDNTFATRPDHVTFQLLAWAEGIPEALAQPIKNPQADPNGGYTIHGPEYAPLVINGLPAYDQFGKKMHYKVIETAIQKNYRQTPEYTTDDQNNSLLVENILEQTSITAHKTWIDNNNQYNSRPQVIQVQLYQNGQPMKSSKTDDSFVKDIQAVSSNDWFVTFDHLPKADNQGVPFDYTVKEVSVPKNYQVMETGATMTNTLTTVSVKGTKAWADKNDQYGLRPASIRVQLYQNGQAMTDDQGNEYTKEVSEQTNWTYSFGELPKVDANGTPYVYTVKEIDPPKAYTASEKGLDVTNTLAMTSVEGKKIWADQGDRFGLRPKEIHVQLYQNGQAMIDSQGTDYTKEVTEKGNWAYTFSDLPKTDAAGTDYVYTVKEIDPPKGYTAAEEGMNVTNTLDTIAVSGEKTWSDDQDHYGLRPASITIQLYQNGQPMQKTEKESYQKEVRASEHWQYRFTDLPKADADGQLYTYSVKEVDTPKAYRAIEQGMSINNQLVTQTISGKKHWIDANDQDGLRPKAITVVLYQNGKERQTKEVTAKEHWQYDFVGLPVYDQNGQKYRYSIGERTVPGYESRTVNDDLFNTHLPNRPQIPNIPRVPNIPPFTPNIPNVPGKPYMPKVPHQPQTPRIPGVPEIPDVPSGQTQRTLPKTNESDSNLPFIAGGTILIGTGALAYARRKKESK